MISAFAAEGAAPPLVIPIHPVFMGSRDKPGYDDNYKSIP